MNRAALPGSVLALLACACSVGDGSAYAAPATRLVTLRTMTGTLKVAGAPQAVLEEAPIERFSVGSGAPETPPVAREDGVPATRDMEVPQAIDAPGPVRVPWNVEGTENGDDSAPSPRPQRIEPPQNAAGQDNGTARPHHLGGNPCCGSPCGVSARSLAALMANPAMTGVDPLTTVAGRSAYLAANRVGASLGQASSGVGIPSGRGAFLGGRGVTTARGR